MCTIFFYYFFFSFSPRHVCAFDFTSLFVFYVQPCCQELKRVLFFFQQLFVLWLFFMTCHADFCECFCGTGSSSVSCTSFALPQNVTNCSVSSSTCYYGTTLRNVGQDFGGSVYMITEDQIRCNYTSRCCPQNVVRAYGEQVVFSTFGPGCTGDVTAALRPDLSSFNRPVAVGFIAGEEFRVTRLDDFSLNITSVIGSWFSFATRTSSQVDSDGRLACCNVPIPKQGEYQVWKRFSGPNCSGSVTGMRLRRRECSFFPSCFNDATGSSSHQFCVNDVIPPPAGLQVAVVSFPAQPMCTGIPSTVEYYSSGQCNPPDEGILGEEILSQSRYTCQGSTVRLEFFGGLSPAPFDCLASPLLHTRSAAVALSPAHHRNISLAAARFKVLLQSPSSSWHWCL
jgi:hypothetical protein